MRAARLRGALLCLLAAAQQVSLQTFINCGTFLCVNSYCCDDHCCSDIQEFPEYNRSPINPYGYIFITLAVIVSGVIFSVACICCYKFCNRSSQQEDVERSQPYVLPASAPSTLPELPAYNQYDDPPPYSEVTSKPFMYPPLEIQPPCYSNVIAEEPPAPMNSIQTSL
ncbi:transmembrane protein 92 precursor [Alligator mississippiensis]|uniref:Transmembrane protein 92 n=2 Tax=Alligator mississippiensis TaxID=8496 RepID=A0A151PC21_ALLMI|nr:transmembrane protein 92 precursor [Alligator mississippiensis]